MPQSNVFEELQLLCPLGEQQQKQGLVSLQRAEKGQDEWLLFHFYTCIRISCNHCSAYVCEGTILCEHPKLYERCMLCVSTTHLNTFH